MTNLRMPLNRFRRQNTHGSLNERWGDSSISAPTGGSWNQLGNHSSPSSEDTLPLNGTASHSSRQTPSPTMPMSMGILNPRRLSMRLKPRQNSHVQEPEPSPPPRGQSTPPDARTEFVYKPVTRPDYPAVVAETAASTRKRQSAPRYKYMPAPAVRFVDEPVRRSRYCSHGDFYDEDEFDDEMDEYQYGNEARFQRSSSEPRGGRMNLLVSRSATEKRRSRASHRLTTVMVPNADEMYG